MIYEKLIAVRTQGQLFYERNWKAVLYYERSLVENQDRVGAQHEQMVHHLHKANDRMYRIHVQDVNFFTILVLW